MPNHFPSLDPIFGLMVHLKLFHGVSGEHYAIVMSVSYSIFKKAQEDHKAPLRCHQEAGENLQLEARSATGELFLITLPPSNVVFPICQTSPPKGEAGQKSMPVFMLPHTWE